MVWASTTAMGCAISQSQRSGRVYIVCNYDPPGNVIGSFLENVFPKNSGYGGGGYNGLGYGGLSYANNYGDYNNNAITYYRPKPKKRRRSRRRFGSRQRGGSRRRRLTYRPTFVTPSFGFSSYF